jgi:NAD(P)-dependent dehydrogenase (short-subunit alcohol dehydrogenase family)
VTSTEDTSDGRRVWLITGASSGFGRAIADAALAAGDSVVATARRTDALSELEPAERVHPVALDVTDADQREAAVAEALERFGRVDVLVNNAGRTQVGAVEETTDEELRALFDLHFFAPAALTRAVLPHMRRQGGGAIVQMSSVGGQTTAPGFGAYCATKFALEGFTETLRDEVAGFGIRTLIVEPGAFRTGLFRPGAAYESAAMPEYAETVGPTRAYVRDNHGAQPGDPAKAARAILTALEADEPPLRLVLGADAIGNIERRLGAVGEELEAWRSLGEATAIEAADSRS